MKVCRSKWFFPGLELLWVVLMVYIALRSSGAIKATFERKGIVMHPEYRRHIDYLIHARNPDGTSLLGAIWLYLLGMSLPFGYTALCLIRLERWFDLRRREKEKTDHDRTLLPAI